MRYFVCEILLSVLILLVSFRLLSKKHGVESYASIMYCLLFYLAVASLQLVGMDIERVRVFCYVILAVSGILVLYFSFSPKVVYTFKGLNVKKRDEILLLGKIVREYVIANNLLGKVGFNYNKLVFYKVDSKTQKELVGIINQFLYKNKCVDYKNFRYLAILVILLQIISLLIQLVYFAINM